MKQQVSQQLCGDFLDIIGEVRRQAECEFVQRYVDVPTIPLMRMQILFLFLQDSGVKLENVKSFLVPTILIQMGLDCHDEVTLLPQSSDRGIRTRQLSVLAGDFYSSKYYFLLSEMEDIALIRNLARAICEINEMKTELYSSKNMDVVLSLHIQNKIDSSLCRSFVDRFGKDISPNWEEIIEKVAFVERLSLELEGCRLGQALPRCLRNRSYKVDLNEVCVLIQKEYDEAFERLQSLVNSIRLDHVRKEMLLMMEACQQRMNNQFQV